ncbi:MAG: response regulator transcription factor [Acidobacteriia bacterium]|nr:response regulator transcription factor [Terriglobia bacterium]
MADSVAMSCRLLAEALQRSKRYLAEAVVTAKQLREALERTPYQVLLISANFAENGLTGFRLVREVRDLHPQLNVVVLLDSLERGLVVEAFRCGAHGVFCRSDSFQTLCRCITCVHEGQVWAGSVELQFVLEALVEPVPLENTGLAGARPLSKREEEIARLVAEGLSNREISRRLQLSEHTIKNYLFRVFEKLGVGTRVELALYAVKRGHVRRSSAQAASSPLQNLPLNS